MKRVSLSDGAAATLAELAKYHGRTQREILEGLLHYAASQMQRPGSWEAQGFEIANYYGPNAFADRWFTEDKTYADAYK